ncbi:CHASE2 domain-containing protein, partial [Nitrospirota bacterium]
MKKLGITTLLATLAIVFTFVGLYYFHAGFLDSIETRTYDFRFKVMRGAIEHNPNIAIVAIDEKSIEEIGRWPWSREVYVPFLQNLQAAGTKALLMDAFFSEEQTPQIDQAFADAIYDSEIVTLSTVLNISGDPDIPLFTISLPVFADSARNLAHINFDPDEDGVNRENILLLEYYNEEEDYGYLLPSLGLMGAMEAMDLTLDDIYPDEDGRDILYVGDRAIPITYGFTADEMPLPKMLINYTGPPGTYHIYSFSDIMKGRIPAEELKDKILFFGSTALGVYDMRESPFHPNTPGVEVHAHVADNIIRGNFITRGTMETRIDVLAMILLSLLIYFLAIKFKPSVALPATAGIIVIYIIFAYIMFVKGSWISMVYPIMTMVFTYAVTGYMRFMIIDKKAREMRSIFSSYVSSKVVDQIAKHPDAANIGGDTKEVTCLFSDVKGYTSYSEKRTPEEVVKTLNEYLGAMAGTIIDSDGTLDKFLGDGIMAYWGAPLPQENHHEQAVGCTVSMLKRLEQLHEKWKSEGTEPFSIRIGLNSGKVVAGNIGAPGKKMEYTLIGDTVNLAARLESTAKMYGITVLVSEYTYQPTKDKFVYRELDFIKVVGKSEPVKVYELIGANDGSTDPLVIEDIDKFKAALELYLSRKWTKAMHIFE